MQIAIRRATPQDAAAACMLLRQSILQSCAEDHQHDEAVRESWLANKTPDTVASWIESASNHCLLAIVGDVVAGVAILTRKGRIGLLHVHPDLRFSGIGKALLGGLEAQARAWGLVKLQVNSPPGAQRFYAGNGYAGGVAVKATYGADTLALSKRLTPAYGRRPACGC
jgi:GNAT superfamily N-acetyltransferase